MKRKLIILKFITLFLSYNTLGMSVMASRWVSPRLKIHCNPDQGNAVTEDEWINEDFGHKHCRLFLKSLKTPKGSVINPLFVFSFLLYTFSCWLSHHYADNAKLYLSTGQTQQHSHHNHINKVAFTVGLLSFIS